MSAFSKAAGSPSRRAFSWGLKAVALTATGLLLASCSSGSSTTTSSSAAGDLELTIGTLLPKTGSLATLGPPEFAGVALAIQEINDADAGMTATEIDQDSGDTTTNIATQSVTSLLASKVGAIIGAASSSVTLTVIDQVVQGETVMISPANTAAKLSTYDDDGYFFRTAPTDLIQGQVIAEKIAADHPGGNISLLYFNDDYGTGLASTIKDVLTQNGLTIAADVEYDPNQSNFTSDISKALEPDPDALVQIGFDESKTIYSELATDGFDFSKLYGTDGNFGLMTSSDSPDIAGTIYSNPGVYASDDFQTRLKSIDSSLTVFSYAAESYDATILAALAALQGGATDPTTIRDNLQSVSADGTKCTTFADCAALIADGTDIDYDGVSGPIDFDDNGDISTGNISLYQYETGNTYAFLETQEATIG